MTDHAPAANTPAEATAFSLHSIEAALKTAFPHGNLALSDASAPHRGHLAMSDHPADVPSHLRIELTDASFAGMAPLARHRAVNTVLQPFFDQGLHAAQLFLKASS